MKMKCFVGSGECSNEATHTTDDGERGIVHVCAFHMEEMEAWEELVSKLSPEKYKAFEAAVIVAEAAAKQKK